MGDHTKEPWCINEKLSLLCDANGDTIKSTPENLRRIVACVNALACISTEQLDARITALESANSTLVRWKGEVDSRRIALGLPFPDDYDSSPKYAVETLIESALAKSASREAALVEKLKVAGEVIEDAIGLLSNNEGKILAPKWYARAHAALAQIKEAS